MVIKLIIVDDNVKFRKNLIHFIENTMDCVVIAEASNGYEFLNIPVLHKADIILMDIAMDVMDGFEATKRATWDMNYLNIIAITMHIEKVFLSKLIEVGFKGCVFKNNIYNDIKKAIEEVMKGNLFFPKGLNLTLKDV